MRIRRGSRGVWVSGAVWALLACSSTASKTEAAEETVRRFFEALPSEDCAVLGPLLATGGSMRPCEEAVREMHEHGLSLVGIVESKLDGRDSDAVLVRARIARDGEVGKEPWLLRVERQAGGWRVRF
ncbi:hypothetical protein HUA74_06165 [Myxococcus sp. CA051A]|uniref:Lipoprotein n=1 Tax=Myxococcus llanfairpwllgwyngyllgogerychwyrndrobwllllantysiliogogogochensis TaxID=2590453 RepID=A0A540WSS6_9BACT|nr:MULTISPECIES: hypothetical protein [Myxococcus]NTX02541.1 hypothetical protein [Myxococcus sp. CA040A]NTX10963.1 hypothetical protein [Myxococcus sp. CA056]NTX40946.1 hypothetical protein [Myxococcus sp. CA033]NTX60238.1 hypothetical protein [Myxococcus sp. CA051A]TQF12081.1 hypothetical protein FJV41_30815 [Myxococcus llanfairpwllgwyngyllgogerychwyrndrobwllllantysiliogogogochensis]